MVVETIITNYHCESMKMTIKSILKKIPFLSTFYQKYKERTKKLEIIPRINIKGTLENYIKEKNQNPFFVVVGANEGITNDYLAKFIKEGKWEGIMIEPVKSTFNLLVKNYSDFPSIRFENCGISDENGKLPIFKFSDQVEGKEYHQLFSFDKNQLLNLNVPQVWKDQFIEEENVPVFTLDSLFTKLEIKKVNIIQIDTEGYDYKVLKGIDFNKIKPELIIYEHCHLRWDVYFESIKLLRNAGYRIFCDNFDTVALLPEIKAIGIS